MNRLLVWALLAAGVCYSTSAIAYLRSTTSGAPGQGLQLWWGTRTVVMKYNDKGSNLFTDQSPLFDAYRRAMKTWSAVACTNFRIEDGGVTGKTKTGLNSSTLKPDGENIIVFRDDEWGHRKGLLALTTVIFNKETGEIVDTDMELNSFQFDFSLGDTGVLNDVENTVVHELGHVLGLDHPCGDDPQCKGKEMLKEATMYQSAPVGETRKRTLHWDDVEGICAIYPLNSNADSDADTTGPGQSGGSGDSCSLGRPHERHFDAWWLLILALIGWLGYRRLSLAVPA